MSDDQRSKRRATAVRRSASTTSLYLGATRPVALVALLLAGASSSLAACSGCSKKQGSGGSSGDPYTGPTTPGMAISIAQARAGYVTNNGSDSISVIDRDGDAVVSVPVDIDPDAHEAPHHLTVDSQSKRLFVALAFPPDVKPSAKKDPHSSHGNATDNGKLARLDLGTLAVRETADVDENPGDVVLTPDRKHVLVSHFDMRRAMDVAARGGASPSTMFAQLVVFDAKDLKRVGARPICVAPHGITVTEDNRTAYIACYGSDELAVVDLASEGLATSRIPLGAGQGVPGVPRFGPYAATLSPDQKLVVVDDLEGEDIRVLDRASKRFLTDKSVPLAAKAFMPAFVDGHTLLVPTQSPDGMVRVDLDRAKVERRTSFAREQCALPHVVRVAKDGRAYVVCEGDHRAPGSVLEIDPATLEVKKRWTVGVYPDGLAFGDD